MHPSDPDPAFAAEVDAYISDESDTPASHISLRTPQASASVSSVPNVAANDSIHLHRQRLNRFHKYAKSFLTNADSNAQHHPRLNENRNADSIDESDGQHVHLDTLRLARFHHQAVSFLNRAYANEPSTLVTEEQLSPAGLAAAHSRLRDRELLQRFHYETLNIIDATASASVSANSLNPTPQSGSQQPSKRTGTCPTVSTEPNPVLPADHTTLRIERDKARLEQHYQDVMSFLNRADNGGDLVEELELGTAALDRLQLQRYAREATSFLDKAFGGDSSILVNDDDDDTFENTKEDIRDHFSADDAATQTPPPFPHVDTAPFSTFNGNVDEAVHESSGNDHTEQKDPISSSSPKFNLNNIAEIDISKNVPDAESQHPSAGNIEVNTHSTEPVDHLPSEEDLQIAEDRAALERYHVEVGDFLSKAYEDDYTVIVDDVESEASNADRGLFARRVGGSALSGSSSFSHENNMNHGDDDSEAHTDNEFQDVAVPGASVIESEESVTSPIGSKEPYFGDDKGLNDPSESASFRMARYVKDFEEAGDFLNCANVEEEDEVEPDVLEGMHESPGSGGDTQLSPTNSKTEIVSPKEISESGTFSGQDISEEPQSGREVSNAAQSDGHTLPDAIASNRLSSSDREEKVINTHEDQDVKMDLRLEDRTGKSQDWNDVRMNPSFYKQIPRGATVRFQRRSGGLEDTSKPEEHKNVSESRSVSESVLRRVEKERDVLMATLEEIVNERSALAAQVSDLKSVLPVNRQKPFGFSSGEGEVSQLQNIDLLEELREAHAIMAQMTIEMEETLSVLEERCGQAVARANAAEEQIIRMESKTYRLEAEIASRGQRVSEATAEGRKARLMLERKDAEIEALLAKSEQDMHHIGDRHREETEEKEEKIQELTNEVERLRSEADHARRQELDHGADSVEQLQARVASLTSKLDDGIETIEKERSAVRVLRAEERKLKECLIQTEVRLNSENERLQREVRKANGEKEKLIGYVGDVEGERDSLKRDVASLRAQERSARAEAEEMQRRYEESLKHRLTKLDQKAELVELEESLQALRQGATDREKQLERQLEDFRRRAERAEAAAQDAERGAKEAAEMARLAQERSKSAIDMERAARQVAESEREALTAELERLRREREPMTSSGSLESGISSSASGAGGCGKGSGGLRNSSSRRGAGKGRNPKAGEKSRRGEGRSKPGEDSSKPANKSKFHHLFWQNG